MAWALNVSPGTQFYLWCTSCSFFCWLILSWAWNTRLPVSDIWRLLLPYGPGVLFAPFSPCDSQNWLLAIGYFDLAATSKHTSALVQWVPQGKDFLQPLWWSVTQYFSLDALAQCNSFLPPTLSCKSKQGAGTRGRESSECHAACHYHPCISSWW